MKQEQGMANMPADGGLKEGSDGGATLPSPVMDLSDAGLADGDLDSALQVQALARAGSCSCAHPGCPSPPSYRAPTGAQHAARHAMLP